jgi:hypothetical protein
VRFGGSLAVLVLVMLVLPRLFEPSTIALVQAMRVLGPVSGWRCAQNATYVYDPHHEQPDSTLLADAPDDVLTALVPHVAIDRVEANLRGGDTVIWTRVVAADANEERRVYVLTPGRLQAVANDLADGRAATCYSHLGDWRVIAEHGLQ